MAKPNDKKSAATSEPDVAYEPRPQTLAETISSLRAIESVLKTAIPDLDRHAGEADVASEAAAMQRIRHECVNWVQVFDSVNRPRSKDWAGEPLLPGVAKVIS